MAEYDGSVKINARLSTDDIKKDVNEVKKDVRQATDDIQTKTS
jgi:hypothetical protein